MQTLACLTENQRPLHFLFFDGLRCKKRVYSLAAEVFILLKYKQLNSKRVYSLAAEVFILLKYEQLNSKKKFAMSRMVTLTLFIITAFTRVGFCNEPFMPVAGNENRQLERTVKNHTYNLLIAKKAITLVNGSFKEGENPENSISASLVQYKVADVNGDGAQDVVVIIEHHGMGSAAFYELSALIQNNGHYLQTKPVLLGGNIEITDFRILSDARSWMPWSPQEISITMLVHKESDSHARPTLEKKACYYFKNNELLDCKEMVVVKKPALYLYPLHKMSVEVVLEPRGTVIQSIPLYKKRWRVIADSNGLIDNKYRYLFYEVALDKHLALPQDGWSVKRSNLSVWFDKYLTNFGLNKSEKNDFKGYWLRNIPASNYYTIKLIHFEIVNDQLGLKIVPEPDSLLRILLCFTPTTEKINMKEPAIKPFKRQGFTVVEWGGILEREAMMAQ